MHFIAPTVSDDADLFPKGEKQRLSESGATFFEFRILQNLQIDRVRGYINRQDFQLLQSKNFWHSFMRISIIQKRISVVSRIVFFLSAFAYPVSAADKLIGSHAPDFTARDFNSSDNHDYVLSRNFAPKNNHAVVICFFASWCGLCGQELKFLQGLTEDSLYKGRLAMVAVCIEDTLGAPQMKMVRYAGLSCPVVLDRTKILLQQYHKPRQLPYSVYINKKGIVVTTVSGYSIRAQRYIRTTLDTM